ncbi:MAG TPA: imidazole glycerol phosphate synthase subunit HisF [Fervidobacterium sp.]|nr:imidazole glycerol phosphate synthase subunit HisF [Fervidobacterium sp.]
MNRTKRIIAALDIENGMVSKGTQFNNVKNLGNPVDFAKKYEAEGIDELVLLDINASNENRKVGKELVKAIVQEISIPLTVGGGLKSVADIVELIENGANKVFVNSAAVGNPNLISEAVKILGSSKIIIAIDTKKDLSTSEYFVYVHGGADKVEINAIDWAKECEMLGAGELLVTSIDTDGMRSGYDLELIRKICENVKIPVIASGGAGNSKDFYDVFEAGADAALAASIFHFGIYTPLMLKRELKEMGINVRV